MSLCEAITLSFLHGGEHDFEVVTFSVQGTADEVHDTVSGKAVAEKAAADTAAGEKAAAEKMAADTAAANKALAEKAAADTAAVDKAAAEKAAADKLAADKASAEKAASDMGGGAKAVAEKAAANRGGPTKKPKRTPTEKPPYKVSYGMLPKGEVTYDEGGNVIGRTNVMCDLSRPDCPPLKTEVHELIADRSRRLRANLEELVADAHAADVPYHAVLVELRRAAREGGRRVGIDVFSAVSRPLDKDERCIEATSALGGVMLATVQGAYFLSKAKQAR